MRSIPVRFSLPLALAALAACGSDDSAAPAGGGGADAGADVAVPPTDGGSSSDASIGSNDGGVGDASLDGGAHPPSDGGPIIPVKACTSSPCINVINACPFPVWIHAVNNPAPPATPVTLTPDDARIDSLGQQQYSLPASWPAARIHAYWQDPTAAGSDPNAFDKVELTYGSGTMNYNITYVDYLALPARIEAVDPACPKTGMFDPLVECGVPVADVLSGCPAGLLDGKRCLSAGLYCADANHQAQAICHALDSTLAQCEQQNPSTCGMATALGNTTTNVYQCSGYFDSQGNHTDGNKWCAALNRGTLSAPDSTDSSKYYASPPFNVYSQWVHATCPGIYAFAYDDYPAGAGQSGFRSCKAARLDVTFCPGG